MSRVFVDTGAWYALAASDDVSHQRASSETLPTCKPIRLFAHYRIRALAPDQRSQCGLAWGLTARSGRGQGPESRPGSGGSGPRSAPVRRSRP
ncbi:MAG: hypothetical protein OXG47_08555, partial [bacterium]|nr:hypothetical protein [bacterium]